MALLACSDLAAIARPLDRSESGWLFWLVPISLRSIRQSIDQTPDGSFG
jgi:hypothetical protein